jgi:hypothetical protein
MCLMHICKNYAEAPASETNGADPPASVEEIESCPERIGTGNVNTPYEGYCCSEEVQIWTLCLQCDPCKRWMNKLHGHQSEE